MPPGHVHHSDLQYVSDKKKFVQTFVNRVLGSYLRTEYILASVHTMFPQKEWLVTYLECLMAMMAAMKKVLSPISDTMMTEMEAAKPWKNRYFFFG